ncbi:MAG TPA: TIR domain-containing protein [Acidimicrobiia bacterium]|nr:TIR domain-containing protein [Acidimicrobiia bacterium]
MAFDDGGRSGRPFHIFISYRRRDSDPYAHHIYDLLTQRFGHGSVFLDVDSIAPGRDFVEVLNETLRQTDALLVVMGPSWIDVVDEQGTRRLDDADDYVRLEIEAALARPDLTVIPVLVGGAEMPAEESLPGSLAPFCRRNAVSLVDEHWRSTMGELVDALERLRSDLAVPGAQHPTPAEPEPRDSERAGVAAAWLQDPVGRHQLRYWDGTAWTEHVADSGQQATDPLGAPSPVVLPAGTSRPAPVGLSVPRRANYSIFCGSEVAVREQGFFALGSPVFLASVLLGREISRQRARKKARKMAKPAWHSLGSGEAVLAESWLSAELPGQHVLLPYRTITSWSPIRSGIEIQRAGWAPTRIEVADASTFQQEFAQRVEGKTWQPPVLQQLEPRVPLDGSCLQDRRFIFGRPIRWFDADDDWLERVGEDYLPAPMLAAIVCQLDDPFLVLAFFVLEIPPLQGEELLTPTMIAERPDEVGAQIAWAFGGIYPDAARLVDLGGERATLMRMGRRGGDPMEVANIFVTHAGAFYWARFAVFPTPGDDTPFRQHELELETILATWIWTDERR